MYLSLSFKTIQFNSVTNRNLWQSYQLLDVAKLILSTLLAVAGLAGYPEKLREVTPEPGAGFWTRRQSSRRSSLFDSDLWTEAGDGHLVVPIPDPCARLITNMARPYRYSVQRSLYR